MILVPVLLRTLSSHALELLFTSILDSTGVFPFYQRTTTEPAKRFIFVASFRVEHYRQHFLLEWKNDGKIEFVWCSRREENQLGMGEATEPLNFLAMLAFVPHRIDFPRRSVFEVRRNICLKRYETWLRSSNTEMFDQISKLSWLLRWAFYIGDCSWVA